MHEEEKKESFEEKTKVEPPNQPEEQEELQKGRKLYATKYGEKYHFESTCTGFN